MFSISICIIALLREESWLDILQFVPKLFIAFLFLFFWLLLFGHSFFSFLDLLQLLINFFTFDSNKFLPQLFGDLGDGYFGIGLFQLIDELIELLSFMVGFFFHVLNILDLVVLVGLYFLSQDPAYPIQIRLVLNPLLNHHIT